MVYFIQNKQTKSFINLHITYILLFLHFFSLFFKQLEVNPVQSIVILNQINENRCCHISDILFLYDI